MMDRLSNPAAKIEAYKLAEELKTIMRPLFEHHMDNIMSGVFSSTMMKDWAAGDKDLLHGALPPAKLPLKKLLQATWKSRNRNISTTVL